MLRSTRLRKCAFIGRHSNPGRTWRLRIGRTEFNWGERTYVMAVLNVTPDSFSGDGLLSAHDWVMAAVERALQFEAEGADIIDVGGESTRPAPVYSGVTPVGADDELKRVLPVITQLSHRLSVPISIDTRKSEVAREAVRAGAALINDVSMLDDPRMATVASETQTPLVISHIRPYAGYEDVVGDVTADLTGAVLKAEAAGVRRDRIIIDPGIGFAKNAEHSLEVIRRLIEFKVLGLPVLVGTSRKSVIGAVLGLPVDDRLEGTAATVALSIAGGADMVRVHDVKAMKRVAKMSDAIVKANPRVPTRPSLPGRPVGNAIVDAYIGLGSNLGDRAANLAAARNRLALLGELSASSSIYETAPWGVSDAQPSYFNQAVLLRTTVGPVELMRALLGIEAAVGRRRTRPGEPRRIDLDLLLYAESTLDEPDLRVPHPRLSERAFVLVPLAEIAPQKIVPGTGKTVRALQTEAGVLGVRKVHDYGQT